VRLAPGVAAAFIDLGDERPAFLPFGEVLPEGKRPEEGARVLVQVRRESQAAKAARVTMRVLLEGSHLEFRAGRKGVLDLPTLSPEERSRLEAVGGEGNGLRFLGPEPLPLSLLLAEAADLARLWWEIRESVARQDPPARIWPAATRASALAAVLPRMPQRVFADDHAALPELRAVFAEAAVAYRSHKEWGVDLDALFERALAPSVALSSGGTLHIETTRAGILIDVDSGMQDQGPAEEAALRVNLEAARAIARELRLRNLGGGIVVDFVGLDRKGMRERARIALSEALAADPAGPRILGWTRLGHLELVRPRKSRPLAQALLDEDGQRKNAATVAFEALRTVWKEARANPGRSWRLTVAPEVAAALSGAAAAGLKELEERLARSVAIATLEGAPREWFQIDPL
jgi:ribonuclease G